MLRTLEALSRPLVSSELKDVLRTARAQLENPAEQLMLAPTASLTPEAIDLDLKVVFAATGGRRGRRAAANGLASVAVAASVINLAVKPLGHRRRPDRAASQVPLARQYAAVLDLVPLRALRRCLRLPDRRRPRPPAGGDPPARARRLVAYSRVHTGIHYPGDVVAGALMGTTLAHHHARTRPLHDAPPIARLRSNPLGDDLAM